MAACIYKCLLSKPSADPQQRLKTRWQALLNIINAKYIDITQSNPKKLASHELIFHIICLLFDEEELIEDLNLAYALSGSLVEHYLPQIISYVASFPLESAQTTLSEFLIPKCGQRLQFAKLAYWHLNAMRSEQK